MNDLLGQEPPAHLLGQEPPAHLLGQEPLAHLLGQEPPAHIQGQEPPAHLVSFGSIEGGDEEKRGGLGLENPPFTQAL